MTDHLYTCYKSPSNILRFLLDLMIIVIHEYNFVLILWRIFCIMVVKQLDMHWWKSFTHTKPFITWKQTCKQILERCALLDIYQIYLYQSQYLVYLRCNSSHDHNLGRWFYKLTKSIQDEGGCLMKGVIQIQKKTNKHRTKQKYLQQKYKH